MQLYLSTLTLTGPYDDNYIKTDNFGVETTIWSPCGVEGKLNVNSEVRLTPINHKKTALMTVGFPPEINEILGFCAVRLRQVVYCVVVMLISVFFFFATSRSTLPISSSPRSTTSSGKSAKRIVARVGV